MLPPIRAFIAIELDERVKRELGGVQEKLRSFEPPPPRHHGRGLEPEGSVRWTESAKLHVTLNFIGDIDPKSIATVEEIMAEVAARHTAFHMDIGTLGAFPSIEAPRTIWAGITRRANLLAEIAADLNACLKTLGFKTEERAFTPHITLGRFKGEAHPRALSELLLTTHIPANLSQKVERLTLLRSELLAQGSEYHVLSSVPLRNSGTHT